MNRVYLLCIAVVATVSTFGQTTTISRNPNIIPYGGYTFNQGNTNEYATYGGIYADYPLLKDSKFNLGVYGIYHTASYHENLTQYNSQSQEKAIGLNGGVYLRGKSQVSFYLGGSAAYRFYREKSAVNATSYTNNGDESGVLFNANANLNLFKDYGILPRTQLIFNWQKLLNAKKTLIENNQTKQIVGAWNRGYYGALIKQSITDARLNQSGLFGQFKLGLGFNEFDQGSPENYIVMGEFALKGKHLDDFLCLSAQYIMIPGINARFINMGASLNVLGLFRFLNAN